MKGRIVILTSLACLCGMAAAQASECIGAGCDAEPIIYNTPMAAPTVLGDVRPVPTYAQPLPAVPQYTAPTEYIYVTPSPVPMRSVKTLSIKPVPEDTRPRLWDGVQGTYRQRGYDKTVDWRDGVPIWDDSIINYKDKDFSDWYLEPSPEIYLREVDAPTAPAPRPAMPAIMQVSTSPDPMAPVAVYPAARVAAPVVDGDTIYANTNPIDLYNQNMEDAAATRARVEELLTPARPTTNCWTDTPDMVVSNNFNMPAPRPEYTAQDMSLVVSQAFGRVDGCPFTAETECEIWRRKPMIRETVAPRSTKLRPELLDAFIVKAKCNKNIEASDPVAAPLLDRYKMLMRSANACCTDGMAYSLKKAGASEGLIYKFLADDANFYGLGNRCLMMTDAEFDAKYPNTATAAVAADVRNGCLCRGRQWFKAMLAPFQDAYAAAPDFANAKFEYTYTDGLQRQVTVSINNDVQNVLNQLEMCP